MWNKYKVKPQLDKTPLAFDGNKIELSSWYNINHDFGGVTPWNGVG
jgi:hypothetical protein